MRIDTIAIATSVVYLASGAVVKGCDGPTQYDVEASLGGGLGEVWLALDEGDAVPPETVTVTNNGRKGLILDISDGESSAGNWLVTNVATLSVPAGESRTFQIAFPGVSALFAGTYTGSVRLAGFTEIIGTPSSPPVILIPINVSVRRSGAGLSVEKPFIDIDAPVPTTWSAVSTYSGPEPRESPTMVCTTYEVLVTGGSNGTPVDTSWLYEPQAGEWRPAEGLTGQYQDATAVVEDGLVYLFGGRHGANVTANATLTVYEPILDTTLSTFTHGVRASRMAPWRRAARSGCGAARTGPVKSSARASP